MGGAGRSPAPRREQWYTRARSCVCLCARVCLSTDYIYAGTPRTRAHTPTPTHPHTYTHTHAYTHKHTHVIACNTIVLRFLCAQGLNRLLIVLWNDRFFGAHKTAVQIGFQVPVCAIVAKSVPTFVLGGTHLAGTQLARFASLVVEPSLSCRNPILGLLCNRTGALLFFPHI